MKKFFALILICTLCLVLCACGQQAQAPETDGGVNIVATVFPAYDFARQIAGDDGNVTLLIPPGSEAHSYEPTPQDIIRMVRENDLAVLLSLHELDLARRISDTVICVAGDRIDRIGTPEEIFTSDYIAQLYHLERGKYDECFSTLEFVP